jgi:hypothetical protein
MFVFSNRRVGPSAEVLVSRVAAEAMLRETAAAAMPSAMSRWEHELVRWLVERADEDSEGHEVDSLDVGSLEIRSLDIGSLDIGSLDVGLDVGGLDVSELAWTREHFESQRSFLIAAISLAAAGSDHSAALTRWRKMIESHPAESVQFGRRWSWASSGTTA